MDRALAIASYKVRFFFGPAFRGRFGGLAYLALVLIFVPTGLASGMAIGTSLAAAGPGEAVNLLSLPLAGILSLALLYSLGAGVTAHPSEFDFFMTAEVRPREYLTADLAFQIVSLFLSGGVATGVAALAMVAALGQPLTATVPLLALLVGYALLVLMVSQVLVVARVRHPKAPVRSLALLLILVSVLPAISMAQPGLPVRFDELPYPSTAFATLAAGVLTGSPVPGTAFGLVLTYVGLVVFLWTLASEAYVFHGIRPTLSAGFGQIDMTSRMDQQRRIIGGMGGLTTRVRLRTDRGGDTGLMARLHLLRIWRDGSILFVLLFGGISVSPVMFGGPETLSTAAVTVTQMLTFLLAILAMNWSYYERENLWLVVTSGATPGSYFRGFLACLAAIGLLVSVAFLALLSAATGARVSVQEAALPLAAPIGAACMAAALLTRVKLRPSSFSPAILGIIFLVAVAGFLAGLAIQGLLGAASFLAGAPEAVQAVLLAAYLVGLAAIGMGGVTRLAAGFRL